MELQLLGTYIYRSWLNDGIRLDFRQKRGSFLFVYNVGSAENYVYTYLCMYAIKMLF